MLLCSFQLQGRRYSSQYTATQDSFAFLSKPGVAVAGVFDGHGRHGTIVSATVAKELMQLVFDATNATDTYEQVQLKIPPIFYNYAKSKLNDTRYYKSGTTALITVELQDYLLIFSAGDSQAFWQERGWPQSSTVVGPEQDRERIEKLGGSVIPIQGVPRVDGSLALARSIGDFEHTPKIWLNQNQFVVTPVPSVDIISKRELSKSYYVLCSDGIKEAKITDEEILATTGMQSGCEKLGRLAHERGSTDDVTVVTVRTLQATQVHLQEEMSRRTAVSPRRRGITQVVTVNVNSGNLQYVVNMITGPTLAGMRGQASEYFIGPENDGIVLDKSKLPPTIFNFASRMTAFAKLGDVKSVDRFVLTTNNNYIYTVNLPDDKYTGVVNLGEDPLIAEVEAADGGIELYALLPSSFILMTVPIRATDYRSLGVRRLRSPVDIANLADDWKAKYVGGFMGMGVSNFLVFHG